jgi:hypothetical protein
MLDILQGWCHQVQTLPLCSTSKRAVITCKWAMRNKKNYLYALLLHASHAQFEAQLCGVNQPELALGGVPQTTAIKAALMPLCTRH